MRQHRPRVTLVGPHRVGADQHAQLPGDVLQRLDVSRLGLHSPGQVRPSSTTCNMGHLLDQK